MVKAVNFAVFTLPALVQASPLVLAEQAEPVPDRSQAAVGVVMAHQKPVFAAAGQHAVRLMGALGDEVVHQNAHIGLMAAQHKRLFAAE